MQEQIRSLLDNPSALEQLYRSDKNAFSNAFNEIYDSIHHHSVAAAWHARLNFEKPVTKPGRATEILWVLFLSLLAGLVAKIPQIFDSINPEKFYPYNISFIVFPFLIIYFIWKERTPLRRIILPAFVLLVSVIYMNWLPREFKDHIILSCIHMPLFLWMVTGYAYLGSHIFSAEKRVSYLRYNGDLIIMANIIMLAGGIFSGITMGLFNLININIAEIYIEYIGMFGAAAIPLISTYLVLNNPALVQKISPIIARIFTPIVFLMLLIYLITVAYTQKDPYNDRDFLILFNALLIGVMAIIFFSLSDATKQGWGKFHLIILFGLATLTLIVDLVVMSAIVFRITEWGVTPNRVAVLGESVLIFVNLLIVTFKIWHVIQQKSDAYSVEKAIGNFMPYYAVWFAVVAFLFPVLFK
jgi:hypothetical protein